MPYYIIKPHVPGRLSDKSAIELSEREMDQIDHIAYIMETWPCDDFVKTSPIYLVSDHLAKAFSDHGFTGYNLKRCELQKDEQLLELYPNSPPLTRYHWIAFPGVPRQDDFGIQDKIDLVVSERAANVVKQFENEYCRYRALA